jgi:acyl carrier protein
MTDKTKEKIETIFIDVMGLPLKPKNFLDLQMGDIEEWDSLANMNLLMELESIYNIRFTIDEMAQLNSISNIIKTMSKKINPS